MPWASNAVTEGSVHQQPALLIKPSLPPSVNRTPPDLGSLSSQRSATASSQNTPTCPRLSEARMHGPYVAYRYQTVSHLQKDSLVSSNHNHLPVLPTQVDTSPRPGTRPRCSLDWPQRYATDQGERLVLPAMKRLHLRSVDMVST